MIRFARPAAALLAAACLAGPVGSAVAADNDPATTVKDVSTEHAQHVLSAAMAKAKEMGLKMNIAVVDAGGNLKAFVRMDGAWLGSIDISIKKAKTARYFDMTTEALGKETQPGKSLYNIEVTNGGLVSFAGGIPIKDADGTIVGAVGVSGSTVDNDAKVAAAGSTAK